MTFPQTNEVSGAIQSIALGPNRLLVGTVNGGVWSTSLPIATGVGNPVWTPLTDQLPSLAIGAVAFDPTDASGNTFYAGTGLFGNGFDVGGPAAGIYRTTDGGGNWTVLNGSPTTGAQLAGHRIKALIADGQTILAGAIDGNGIDGSRDYIASGGGLFRSTDGGATFFEIAGVGAGDLPDGAVTSLALDPNNATALFAAVSGQGVFRSNNLGAAGSWTPVNSGLTTVSATTTDIELSSQNIGGATTLFAGVEDDGTRAIEVFTSTNSGGAWTQLAAVPAALSPPNLGSFGEKLNIIADPTTAGVAYITSQGRTGVYRYDPSGAGSWVQIDQSGTQNNSSPHPDSRDMAFSGGSLLVANDGGIFEMTTPLNTTANDWISLNGNLRTFELYAVAYDSTNNVIFAGAQDNGSPAQTAPNGIANWTDLTRGDGQFQAADTVSLGGGHVYRYSMSNNFQFFKRTEFDNSNNKVGSAASVGFRSSMAAAVLSGLNSADLSFSTFMGSGRFDKVPFALNSVDPTRMLVGYNGVYEDAGLSVGAGGKAGDVVAEITSSLTGLAGRARAVLYGGRRDGSGQLNVALVGTTSGQLYFRGESGSAFTRVDGAAAGQLGGSGAVLSIAADPENWRRVFVVKGDQVFSTNDITNLAANPFQVIGGGGSDNLLSMTGQLRTVTAVDVAGKTVPLVAGKDGLFRSLAPGEWTAYGNGLPNVVAYDVVYDAGDNLMVLGTFGRGAWTISNPLTSLATPAVMQITGDQDFPRENDTFRLVRDANSPALVHVFVNGVEDPASPFQLATVQQINVNGLGGNDTLIIDDSNGLINAPNGIQYDGGAGFNNLRLVQTGGDTQFTDAYSVGPNNGEGSDVITGPSGIQTVYFQNLAPVLNTVPAALAFVNATPSNNAINYTAGAVVANGLVTIDNQESFEFSNKASLFINARAGTDTINLNNPFTPTNLTSIFVAGNDPTASGPSGDALIVNGTANEDTVKVTPFGANAGEVAITGLPTVNFGTIESLVYNGQGGGDHLTVTTQTVSSTDNFITLTPGAADDSGAMTFLAQEAFAPKLPYGVPFAFENLGVGAALPALILDSDHVNNVDGTLIYHGTAGPDFFAASIDQGSDPSTQGLPLVQLNGGLKVLTPGITNLSFIDGAGANTFSLLGPLAYTSVEVNGNAAGGHDRVELSSPAADVKVELPDTTIPATLGGLSGPLILGFGAGVTLSGIATANINLLGSSSGVTLIGTPHNDDITYTPTGLQSGTFAAAGLDTVFNFFGVQLDVNGLPTTGLLVAGNGGSADRVTLQGSVGRNLFALGYRDALNRYQSGIVDTSGAPSPTLFLASDVQNLSALGVDGENTFIVSPTSGIQFPPANLDNLVVDIDGGNGTQNNALLIESLTGDLTGGSIGPLAANQFVVVNRGVAANTGTVRTYTAAVKWPDINYKNIQVVSPDVAGDGNLLVMGPDTNEPNGLKAANLGVAGDIIVPHGTIFPNNAEFPLVPADVDRYSVVARQTGTLDVIAHFERFNPAFLPGGGRLVIQAADGNQNLIASSTGGAATFGAAGLTQDARIRIPVVAGQRYFIAIFGATASVVNGYDLSIVNTPAVVPFNLELSRSVPPGAAGAPDTGALPPSAPGDDTGRTQFDDVTKNSTPRIYLRLPDGIFLNDLPGNGAPNNPPAGVIPIPFSPNAATPGFRVAIFDGDDAQNPVGFASQVAGFPGLYQFDFPNPLADGVHKLTAEVQMVDPAAAAETGFGAASGTLSITIDSAKPPVAFGTGAAGSNTGLDGPSDSGVGGQQPTVVDRITNVSTPTVYGVAEANSIVRLYDDVNNNGLVDAGDVFLGQTTAVPGDGTNAFATGQWRITSNVDLNSSKLGFPLDGLRNLLTTAEDLAGNVSLPKALSIFIDTQGPKVGNVSITGSPGYNLFLNKPATPVPTPLVYSLDVTFNDQPVRVGPDFIYPAVNTILAKTVGNYSLLGQHSGPIAITSITFADSTAAGTPGMSVATLHFKEPLPDDRYTLTVSDRVADDAGNALDGEFNGSAFPSGNGAAGGFLVGSFSVDSRPEVGVYSSGTVSLDLNGNGTLDPQNSDANNRDTVVTLGHATDRVFAGQFSSTYGSGAAPVVNGFDKLASYGQGTDGNFRWLYDLSGVSQGAPTVVPQSIAIDGLPVAGNFDGSPLVTVANRPPRAANGQQVGLFDGNAWYLDVLNQGYISAADVAAAATATHPAGKLLSNMAGLPFVGDFDGDGFVDLATYQSGVMQFDLSSLEPNHIVRGRFNETLDLNQLFPSSTPFNTVNARPLAADLDADGVTDFGLYVTNRNETDPDTAHWYFIESNFGATAPNAASALTPPLPAGNPFQRLLHTFQSPALGGHDAAYQLGNQFALPVVGNFDPPGAGNVSTDDSDTDTLTDAWVTHLYTQILGRQPTAADVSYWVDQVVSGKETRAELAQFFVTSDEFRAHQINQMYQQHLGRPAEAAGIAHWTGVWNETGGPEQVRAGIISSAEFFAAAQQRYPGLSANAAWATALYQDLLDRPIETDALNYWVSVLDNRGNPREVVLSIVTSDEFRYQLVDNEFQTYLGRALDQPSAQAIIQALRNGLTQDQLLTTIVSSNEYFNKA